MDIDRPVPAPPFDYHLHTRRCGHATGEMAEYVERAARAGLTEIGFSDHLYLYWLPESQRDPELGMAAYELDEYVEDVLRLRRQFPDMTIRLAIEADYIEDWHEELGSILARYPWDYVLGSVHFIGEWGFDDSRYRATYDDWDTDALYDRYFELLIGAAETGLFDSMAHPDLVKKFAVWPSERYDVSALYRRVADAFRRSGVCVEVNTAGLRYPCSELYPSLGLLRACREAGVPATLGSDAHRPEHVAYELQAGIDHLRAAGYEEILQLEGRRRTRRLL